MDHGNTGASGAGSISVYAWVVLAGAILMVLVISALAIKHILYRRRQAKQQRIEDGDAIFGPVVKNPVQK